jgi:hypothetical protein
MNHQPILTVSSFLTLQVVFVLGTGGAMAPGRNSITNPFLTHYSFP